MIKAYRVADPVLSGTPGKMLSGYGASLHGGRWNSPGHSMVYMGDSIAQASMEILVHAEEAGLLDDYVLLEVQIPASCVLRIRVDELPQGWDDPAMMNAPAQRVGDHWLGSEASLALEVPSIAVPGGANLLLNPRHADFDRLVVGEIEPYRMDQRIRRLFAENQR